ncbi:helix-turn-helix domain-containing protein [Halobaculum magnesiiphilum]|uniref:Helix-turn-helix domain-containing protein n=1 Tax=Halobaculum magnesiiphilum TaxID=1017351 RepID=A0A8T8WBA4_9EURY|nr:helix-turn-helix domain-containing protein [Halobaculum magnesiiphilum]QZP37129.1 helix-turn-helix domain-containing protein [Halobaculum magnesiiphilum]
MIAECLVVEVRVSGDDCPLAEATAATRTPVRAEPPQLRADGNVLLRFGAPRDDDLAARLDADDRIRYLHRSRSGERDTYRCLSKQPCVVHELVSAGLLVEAVTYRDGDATVTGAVVGHEVLRGVMETAGETVGVELTRTYPLREEPAPVAGRFGLTPPQTEALRAAVEAGYFAVPRAASSEEVAAELGLSKSAFLERLRRAEATLYRDLFAE